MGKKADGSRWQERITVEASNKTDARRLIEAEKVRLLQAAPVASDPRHETVGQYLHRWLDKSVHLSTGARTAQQYRRLVNNHVLSRIGHIRLTELTSIQVREMFGEMRVEGNLRTGGTLAFGTLYLIKSILQRALQEADLPSNPVKGIKLSATKQKPAERISLEAHQVHTLLRTVQGSRWRIAVWLGVYLGLRLGELLALRWSDIDGKKVTIRRNLVQYDDGTQEMKPPKNDEVRPLVLCPALLQELQRHRDEQEVMKHKLGDLWEDEDLVFPGPCGRPWNYGTVNGLIWRYLAKACVEAGLPRISYHNLRHTCATLMLDKNVPLDATSKWLGHSDIRTTAEIYRHHTHSTLENTASAIGDAIGL